MFEFCLTCRGQVKLLSEQASTTVFQKILQDAGQPRLNPLLSFVSESFLVGNKKGDRARWRQHLARLPRHTPSKVQLADTISIGQSSDLTAAEQSALREQLKEFIPWRKGPFDLFGIEIDSEWRCDMKWSRLEHLIAPLEGRTVLDVGSGNGYFSLRMAAAGAELVVGLEPHMAYFAQFCALAHFLPDLRAVLLPIRWKNCRDRCRTLTRCSQWGDLSPALTDRPPASAQGFPLQRRRAGSGDDCGRRASWLQPDATRPIRAHV